MSKRPLRSDKKPSISVVLATLGNNLDSLKRCLESLKEQTFRNFEVIVVHPHKHEGELIDMCKFYNAIPVEENSKSLGAARNTGVQHARGSLITFTDDDCEFPERWLEKIYSIFQQHRNISSLGGPDLTPPSDKNNVFRATFGTFEESRRQNDAFNRFAVNKIKGANVTYEKRVFEEVGYLNTSLEYGEDLEFNIRLVENGYHLMFHPKVFVWHHRRETLSCGLKHLLMGSIGSAPLFVSWKVFTYSRYESLIASFYLANILLLVSLAIFLVSPTALCFFILILLLIYTVFTVLRTSTHEIGVICCIPVLITLSTLTRLLGFYLGIAKYIFKPLLF